MSSSSDSPDKPDSSKKYPYEVCQMRKVNGDPCTSPAVHGERFCHYHMVMGPSTVGLYDGPFDHVYLPRLENAASIQAAISQVCELMLHRRIEPKEASALFYAMQVASQNLGPFNGNPSGSKTQNGDAAPNPETSNPAANSATSPDPLPPGTIQACAEQPPRRRRGRPRKSLPQLVQSK
jgi:hypothetical protein